MAGSSSSQERDKVKEKLRSFDKFTYEHIVIRMILYMFILKLLDMKMTIKLMSFSL